MPINLRDANGNIVAVATPDEVIAAINSAVGKATTSAVTMKTTSSDNVTLIASTTRKGVVIYNDAPAALLVKFGAVAAADSYSLRIQPQETEIITEYIGRIDAILEGGGAAQSPPGPDNGIARITELTA